MDATLGSRLGDLAMAGVLRADDSDVEPLGAESS
jgi:hypothetical protein